MKNHKRRWKYCQCLEFHLFLFVEWSPNRADQVIWLVAVLLLVEDKHVILYPTPRNTFCLTNT